ncbi:hypothetical protein N7516_001322 [Penicillium verrucosum]|uniref:uncharacterized protein n=1 Tax=Penicillium verrucosum TaxID=60171 RepID=UPI0025455DFD|nr:uncharacterized protein N7516_001322 [Penicillium verrucosum]KAJ5941154.1 hypothetical protein N7516_001322 [Penicillium verrucosum]
MGGSSIKYNLKRKDLETLLHGSTQRNRVRGQALLRNRTAIDPEERPRWLQGLFGNWVEYLGAQGSRGTGGYDNPPYSSYGFEELALLVKRKGGQEGNNRILPSEGGYKRGWGVVVCTTNRCRWREWMVATLTGWNGDLEVVSNELPEDCRS